MLFHLILLYRMHPHGCFLFLPRKQKQASPTKAYAPPLRPLLRNIPSRVITTRGGTERVFFAFYPLRRLRRHLSQRTRLRYHGFRYSTFAIVSSRGKVYVAFWDFEGAECRWCKQEENGVGTFPDQSRRPCPTYSAKTRPVSF